MGGLARLGVPETFRFHDSNSKHLTKFYPVVIKNKYICNQQVGEKKFCLELESFCIWQNTVTLIYIALIPSAFWFKMSWIASDSVYAIFSIYKIFLPNPFYFPESF